MQLLFEESFEYGRHAGLGLLKGRVCPLSEDLAAAGIPLKVPQMGWNALTVLQKENPLMRYTRDGDFMYYVHSFYAKGCADSIVATSEYGVPVPGVVSEGNVYGCQFHPEKSSAAGLQILKAFGEMS
jgi:glutamine amidotransferase